MTQAPNDPKLEAAAALLKGAVSAIPVVGGVIAEVGNLYLNPLERRKQRWMEEVSTAVTAIQERFSLLPLDLEHDERFISFLYQATMLALKNHQEAKLDALRHALISSAGLDQFSEDLGFQFLRYIDELTPTHLVILSQLAARPVTFAQLEALEEVYTAIQQSLTAPLDRPAFRAFLHDLDSRFLLRIGDIADFPEYQSKRSFLALEDTATRPLEVTQLGHSFLAFVQD